MSGGPCNPPPGASVDWPGAEAFQAHACARLVARHALALTDWRGRTLLPALAGFY